LIAVPLKVAVIDVIRSQHKLVDQAPEISVEQVGLAFADLRRTKNGKRA